MEIGKELAKQLLTIIQGTKDFVVAQAPDVVRQLVDYQLISAIAYGVLGLVFLIGGVFLGKKFVKMIRDCDDKKKTVTEADIAVGMGSGIGSAVGSLAGFIMVLSNLHDVLLWWLAPKVALLQYLRHLL